jgi:hypothetical protein
MIKHEPRFDTEKICQHYSEKDGVPITYVCTSALGSQEWAMDIFYRETPHPTFGNRYFGIYNDHIREGIYITNADKIEELEFGLVEDDEGRLVYSSHRHDFKSYSNGNMIDGGRAYIKCSGKVLLYFVKDGELVRAD